jgi:hypothetical protein
MKGGGINGGVRKRYPAVREQRHGEMLSRLYARIIAFRIEVLSMKSAVTAKDAFNKIALILSLSGFRGKLLFHLSVIHPNQLRDFSSRCCYLQPSIVLPECSPSGVS